jgi:hypothetical protein
MMPDQEIEDLRRILEALLAKLDGKPRGRTEPLPDEPKTSATAKISAAAQEHSEASHPGLERFPLAETPQPSVPRTCFIEPGRTCVNSGACEMRGY